MEIALTEAVSMTKNQFKRFESRDKLAHEFANDVARILSDAVKHQGYATMAVSGGSRPKQGFAVGQHHHYYGG